MFSAWSNINQSELVGVPVYSSSWVPHTPAQCLQCSESNHFVFVCLSVVGFHVCDLKISANSQRERVKEIFAFLPIQWERKELKGIVHVVVGYTMFWSQTGKSIWKATTIIIHNLLLVSLCSWYHPWYQLTWSDFLFKVQRKESLLTYHMGSMDLWMDGWMDGWWVDMIHFSIGFQFLS